MEDKKINTHKNHRKRLKSKVSKFGLDCLEYHEVLELLLTYAIPRKDTNPIGHNLIENFGSFCDVIDADYHDLLKVDGIGPESALFINVLSSMMEIYNKSKQERTSHTLNGTGSSVKFFRTYYPIKSNEFMILVGLSAKKKVVKIVKQKGFNDVSVSFNFKEVINKVNDQGVSSVVMFHTHPNGSIEPSNEDLLVTQTLVNAFLANGIDVEDHIILNETEYYSFHQNNLLSKMKEKYSMLFNLNSTYALKTESDKSKK